MLELLTQSRGEGPHGLSNDNMWFSAIGDDPMAELLHLQQKTSLDAYHEEFNSIITRLKLSDDHILTLVQISKTNAVIFNLQMRS